MGKDLETNETTVVAMQQHGKHASTTIVTLETVFYIRSMQRGYKEDNWGKPVSLSRVLQGMLRRDGAIIQLTEFCTGNCEDSTRAREAEESPLLEAIAREWLVKTQ
jgi:hypothetical protein